MKKVLMMFLLFLFFLLTGCFGGKVCTQKDMVDVNTQSLTNKSKDKDDYAIITDDRVVQEDAENYFASWVQVSLWNEKAYLFHLSTLRYDYELVCFYLAKRFEQHQKIVKENLVGKPFYYVLYKLKFYNSLLKPYCYEFDRCSGYIFFDPETKRLLILYGNNWCYACDQKTSLKQMKFLEDIRCRGIEYFDLKKGIYEFAGFMPQYDVKDDKIIIIKDVFEGIFPGIDKDYYFEVELKIDKEIEEIFGGGFGSVTPFNISLYHLDEENLKKFDKLKKLFEKKSHIEILETNDMKYWKESGDDERVKNAIKEYLEKKNIK